ncbi:hypothetical protein Bca52824_029509 [Brassica carinata]|uniref:Uncharacterized protein n=1 Tax=Brassica carinata TaxID=52824 RepID=A0A8X7VEH4_BRACI|nr:hypothetical protein Bca52824_029509 [Brassica carinata]
MGLSFFFFLGSWFASRGVISNLVSVVLVVGDVSLPGLLPLEVRFRSCWLCEVVVVDSVSIVTDGTRVSLLVWSAQLSSGFGELSWGFLSESS